MRRFLITLTIMMAVSLAGCAQQGSIFSEPGDNIATPSAMAVDVNTNRLYLVNSNAKVLYDWTKGSFQVLDITNPLAPTLIKSVETPSFSGQIYLNVGQNTAYVPNRFSANDNATNDALFVFNVDELSTNFLSYNSLQLGENPYAISCCYPAARVWITTSSGELQYVDTNNASPTAGSIMITTTLANGGELSNVEVNHIALLNNQAFLSREFGGIMVVNLDDAGVTGAVPVDYFISDVQNPRGIATDGKYIYVVGEGDEDGDYRRTLTVLDPSTLTPLYDNTTTWQLDKNDNNLLVSMIDVGQNPQEVLLTSQYAFVTNQDDDTVSVINLANVTTATAADATISVGLQPFSLALYRTNDGVDKYVYVGNVESNTISIIDIPSLSVVATYDPD